MKVFNSPFTPGDARTALDELGYTLDGPYTGRWLWVVEDGKGVDRVRFESDAQLMYFTLGILWSKEANTNKSELEDD